MALTTLQQIRYELGDMDPAFPMLVDAEYEYFLEKHNDSVRRASLDAAKTILLKLSMRTSSTVDIFSISGAHHSADQYRQALYLYVKDPNLSSTLGTLQGYFGGVSKSDMKANDANPDNNTILRVNESSTPTDYFSV
jgi:hypothetical protein